MEPDQPKRPPGRPPRPGGPMVVLPSRGPREIRDAAQAAAAAEGISLSAWILRAIEERLAQGS